MALSWQTDTTAYAQFFTTFHLPDTNAEQYRSYNELLRLATSPANAVAMMRSFHRADVRDSAANVRCPTLVMHSRGESIIPFDWGREVAAQIPNALFVPLESRNHVLLPHEPSWPQMVEALDEFLLARSDTPIAVPVTLENLTPREDEVLELVAQALDNTTIGKHLGISEHTARNHVSTTLSKLGVSSRAQTIVRGRVRPKIR